jgi:cell wall-associated NlpC family hydrolase
MANTIYIKTSSKNAQPTKRFTRNPTILLTTIFALFLVSAQAKTTGQNEKFNSNPFPNPKTLMKLTTNTAASVSTVVSTASTYTALLSNAVTSSHTTSVAASVAMPNEPLAQRRQSVAWFAASYSDWGYKYQSGSSSIENGGFDCSGFVMYVLNYFDIKTKRTAAEQYTEGRQMSVEEAKAGDLVFFGGKSSVSHVAMVISNDEKGLVVVHSTNTKGVTQENISDSKYWKAKLKDRAVNILGE